MKMLQQLVLQNCDIGDSVVQVPRVRLLRGLEIVDSKITRMPMLPAAAKLKSLVVGGPRFDIASIKDHQFGRLRALSVLVPKGSEQKARTFLKGENNQQLYFQVLPCVEEQGEEKNPAQGEIEGAK